MLLPVLSVKMLNKFTNLSFAWHSFEHWYTTRLSTLATIYQTTRNYFSVHSRSPFWVLLFLSCCQGQAINSGICRRNITHTYSNGCCLEVTNPRGIQLRPQLNISMHPHQPSWRKPVWRPEGDPKRETIPQEINKGSRSEKLVMRKRRSFQSRLYGFHLGVFGLKFHKPASVLVCLQPVQLSDNGK
jgi:hypothetical protein